MSEPYQKAKAARLTFKGGELAAVKSIDKKKKKKKKQQHMAPGEEEASQLGDVDGGGEGVATGGEQLVYTIDAAKRMKYEELFPVETRKFGYDPANKSRSTSRTVEESLDDRVKKKADRYCK